MAIPRSKEESKGAEEKDPQEDGPAYQETQEHAWGGEGGGHCRIVVRYGAGTWRLQPKCRPNAHSVAGPFNFRAPKPKPFYIAQYERGIRTWPRCVQATWPGISVGRFGNFLITGRYGDTTQPHRPISGLDGLFEFEFTWQGPVGVRFFSLKRTGNANKTFLFPGHTVRLTRGAHMALPKS